MKKSFYLLYIGDYQKGSGICAAPSIFSQVPFKHLSKTIAEVLKLLRNGLECYIVTPKGNTYGWYRDLAPLPKAKIKEILQEENINND